MITKKEWICDKIKNRINEIEEVIKNDNKIDELRKKQYQDEKKSLLLVENDISSRLQNPRKVKRYLLGIKNTLNIVDIFWFSNSEYYKNEYSKENWVDAIMEVEFVKNFLPEYFEEMMKYSCLDSYRKNYEFSIIDKVSDLSKYNNKVVIIDLLLYKLYNLDCTKNKSKQQNLLDELDSNNINANNICVYITQCLSLYADTKRLGIILDFLEKENLKDNLKKEAIINVIFL